MRKFAVWALQATLALGLGAVLAAAEEPAAETPSTGSGGSWLSRVLPFGKKEEKKPTPAPKNVPPRETVKSPPPPVESAAVRRAREKEILDRRQAVCLRLRAIADENDDDALRRMAEHLDERAWALYCQHTGQGGGPAGGQSESDEQILDRHLPRARGNGQGPAAATGAAAAPDRESRTAARRELP